jgi:hypothetical protein
MNLSPEPHLGEVLASIFISNQGGQFTVKAGLADRRMYRELSTPVHPACPKAGQANAQPKPKPRATANPKAAVAEKARRGSGVKAERGRRNLAEGKQKKRDGTAGTSRLAGGASKRPQGYWLKRYRSPGSRHVKGISFLNR